MRMRDHVVVGILFDQMIDHPIGNGHGIILLVAGVPL
jgi:hypothetical protein